MEDTIVGISTAQGVGAISIIRVSGKKAIEITNKVFSKNLENIVSHTINYGYIKNDNEIIDEVLLSLMKAPKSYTMEDVIEINCHGGIATTKKIMEMLIINGARLSEPGEFTKRAFLNGRIKLNEAEGVMNLINAQTENQRKLAINRVGGKVTALIRDLRKSIIKVLGNIEVNIDFPEYEDILDYTHKLLKTEIINFKEQIKKIIKETEDYKIVSEGIKTVILGQPNVGKSSLLNNLMDQDKAIVTNIPGTTRDIVEGKIVIDGFILNLIDTAGIRKTDDIVEKIGVDKSLNLINEADLILLLFDNNKKLTIEDLDLIEKTKEKNVIKIINKTDLENQIESSKIGEYIGISLKNNEGIEKIKEQIKSLLNLEKLTQMNPIYIANTREITLLKKIVKEIEEIEGALENQMPIDMIEIDIKQIWNILGEMIGDSYEQELIDELFTNFCLGK